MKKIEAIIRKTKFEDVKEALLSCNYPQDEVRGCEGSFALVGHRLV